MEDKVPFKAYTYWKDQQKPEVRRFGIEKSVVTSYCYLDAKLQDVYPGLKNKHYTVSWKDEEGDEVIISSDEEMIIALSAINADNLMKLYIYCDDEQPKEIDCDVVITTDVNAPADNNLAHLGVVCDVCDAPIVGFRYKCTSCADFDLCSNCESGGHHSEHIMVRVPTPNLPRTTIRAAIRRSRHIMKTVASSVKEPESAHKKSKNERTSDRKRHHSHHGEGNRGDHQSRRLRISWFETFANYMNEFADLAGDTGTRTEKNNDKATKNAQNVSQEQTKDCGNAQTAAAKEPEATISGATTSGATTSGATTSGATGNVECPFSTDANHENIQKLVKMVFGADISNLLSQLAPSQVQSDENNQNKQESEADKQSVKSDASSTTKDVNDSSKKDESPERATDGWTVINNEKDLMDMDATPSAPNDPMTIGFNLPEEFQERVRIGEGQSLYPPLHSAAAVLNPKEPESRPSQEAKAEAKVPVAEPIKQKISQPSPSQSKAQMQPPQPTLSYHFKPHIDAAIKQMLGMGFTNEDGWLTQLLENVDGNIAAVLDLLTPITQKK